MTAKGRDRGRFTVGHGCKLTDDDVRAIRADGRPQREIAAEYEINPATVCRIRNRQWRGYVE
jgi:hypothetical protein